MNSIGPRERECVCGYMCVGTCVCVHVYACGNCWFLTSLLFHPYPLVADSKIIVCTRSRPPFSHEGTCDVVQSDPVDSNVSVRIASDRVKTFFYDHVFGPSATQNDVYHSIGKPMVDDLLRGINACVIAYGQTGTFPP
jgi:hypothetical protein